MSPRTRLLTAVSCLTLVAFWLVAAEPEPAAQKQADLMKKFQDGNYNDAYIGFRARALAAETKAEEVPQDLAMAIASLQQLGRMNEIDALLAASTTAHAKNWRLLSEAAKQILQIDHGGFQIVGQFERGNHRGGGKYMTSLARDRVQALQWLLQALALARDDENKPAVAALHLQFAEALRFGQEAWKLQALTDLTQLPDYEENHGWGWGWNGGSTNGAPVDAEGNPVFHQLPKSFEEAKSDGERWRWMLTQAAEIDAKRLNETQYLWASFLYEQFGEQTLAVYSHYFYGRKDDGQSKDTGTFALHTLKEDETIARLASGVKRFPLPDEFNFLKIYRSLAGRAKDTYGDQAHDQLAQIFENRRQYVTAATVWREAIKVRGKGSNDYRQQRLDQIVKNWGRFEPVQTHAAGKGPTLDYRFRNGTDVKFTAYEINLGKLLADCKAYFKSNPEQIDWNKSNIQDLGYRLVYERQNQYFSAEVAQWSLKLKPQPGHVDDRVTVTTPLQKAGAYLVTAQMANGNVSRIIVWVNDTVLVQKQLDKQILFFVADAVTGQPVPKANVEFFGWTQEQIGETSKYRVVIKNFAEFSNANGQVILDEKRLPTNYNWLITARTDAGRLAYLGFENLWFGQKYDEEYEATKVFTITDRPVYRPEQKVQYKLWLRHAKYDQEDTSSFAEQAVTVRITDPQGETIKEEQVTTDKFGGVAGEYELPKGAKLGVYQIFLVDRGGGSFRVEEYKKPEFEVTVEAPREPIQLGEKITAKVQAKYLFGAPVTEARVTYKVLRSDHDSTWHPYAPWDWFYGRGYGWFAYDYTWYPGWGRWGCFAPPRWWWGQPAAPPEMVLEGEAEIGADGTFSIEIDTALAKEMHGDSDHKYAITAEVTDQSRRTIVGTGDVLVAREPFKVFAWVDRGHYRAGDTVEASFQAQTLDQKPVEGKGELTLFKISYDAQQKPVEKAVETWEVATNDEGTARQQFKAAEPGQYRLSYKLTDTKEHTIEGGYIFVVRGESFDGRSFRFNDLELVADKQEYAPGETIRLMINTNRTGGTVLLFLRPTNGVYLPPKLIRLEGKSTVEEIAVVAKDMPNFFIEAVTVSDNQVHEEAREIAVPPQQRVINVEVLPSQTEYKPGAEAKVQVKLTGLDGKPFVGSTVLAVYDKAVEYISGGSNVPEIKEFFWKWKRHHHPQTTSSLARYFDNLFRPNETPMSDLGIFGNSIVEELAWSQDGIARFGQMGGMGGGFGGGGYGNAPGAAMPMAASAPAEGAAMEMSDSVAKSAAPAPPPGTPAGAAPATANVRSNFADTAYWAAAILTGEDGTAEVAFNMPENLTGWKIKAWAMGHGTKVGQGESEVVTTKNLLLRLQAPRFFVQKDEVVLSANIHNYLKTDKEVQAVLELDGETLAVLGEANQTVMIPAGGEHRVDWRVKVNAEGEAVVRMKALSDEESDAMEMRFPVYVHGMLKTESFANVIRPDQETGKVEFTVPEERRINDARLEVRYSPTLAGALVDALPYLVDYPYGCTEQTLNRFLPTVITQNILQRMNLDLKAIQEKRTNLNAQELGDAGERAAQWKQRPERNPVFDEAEVERMAKEGLERLTAQQLSDGGWGWFSGYGEQSWPHTTAVVVHGLQVAKQNDVALVPEVLERGVAWLKRYQAEEVQKLQNAPTMTKPWKEKADNLDAMVYMVLVDADVANEAMRDFLYRDRNNLAVYSKAMFGLALHTQQQMEMRDMLLQNIEQFVQQDEENQTAWLQLPEDGWWYWYGSENEAHAYYLKLISRVNPQDPRASRLVKYLLNNRKHATYWDSTRDTALCIEALADYMQASGEDKPDMTLEVWLDGEKRKEVQINAENLFSFDNQYLLLGDGITTGKHTLELKKKGTGPVYFNAYLTNFTLEDFITKAGLEVKVQRKFYKLTRQEDATAQVAGTRGQVIDQKVEKYDRAELENLSTLKSGDLVEVELEIDSKNDYEYLVFEDMKAAGFEPVDLRSGYTGNEMGAYVEFRDERVCFFVRQLARGKHSVTYRIRAEIPGKFSALPTRASAMYAPELKGNSDEIKLGIED